jgi:hypothetical protein
MKRTANSKQTRPFVMASVEIKSSGSKSYNRPSSEAPSLQDSLKCKYLNATSLDNKFDEFRVVIDSYCPQIVAVRETWFKNNSIANVNAYNLFRKDRVMGAGEVVYTSTKEMVHLS